MKKYIEVSETNKITGRTPIRIGMHEIHKDLKDWNKNGIHWKREYVEKNMHTANGAPIVAEFMDEDFDMPHGHGDVYVDENNEVYFKNSVVVGAIESTSIEEVEINGETKTILVANGYLYNQRFPEFVKWIKETNEYENVMSSVEVGATPPNKQIVYDGGWKKEGRIPMDYQYTGHAILSIDPADDSAVLIEINKFKEDKRMSKTNEQLVSELNEKLEAKISEINELKNTIKEKDSKISEVETELNSKSEELNAVIEGKKEVESELNELKDSKSKLDETVKELNEFKKGIEDEKLKSEFNAKLEKYTDEEKEVAKDAIGEFNEAPSKEKMDEIVSEINSSIAKKIIESRNTQTEINNNQEQADDIFGDVIETNNDNSMDDLF